MNTRNRQTTDAGSRLGAVRGCRWENGEWLLVGPKGVSLGGNEMFRELVEVMSTGPRGWAECHGIGHYKMANFMLCEFYFNFVLKLRFRAQRDLGV